MNLLEKGPQKGINESELYKRVNKMNFLKVMFVVVLVVFSSSFVMAGVGIKSSQGSILLDEGKSGCVSVGAYNPFEGDTNVIIGVSDSLKEVLTLQEADTKLLPAYTSSDNAIPLKFCFEVPKVYIRDCSVGSFICELTCDEPQKVYEGEVFLKTVPLSTIVGGVGGSATSMSVSTPLRVRVQCNAHPRNYTLLYVILASISALVIFFVLFNKYRKPKAERDREKLRKLKAEIAKESGKSRKKK